MHFTCCFSNRGLCKTKYWGSACRHPRKPKWVNICSDIDVKCWEVQDQLTHGKLAKLIPIWDRSQNYHNVFLRSWSVYEKNWSMYVKTSNCDLILQDVYSLRLLTLRDHLWSLANPSPSALPNKLPGSRFYH